MLIWSTTTDQINNGIVEVRRKVRDDFGTELVSNTIIFVRQDADNITLSLPTEDDDRCNDQDDGHDHDVAAAAAAAAL